MKNLFLLITLVNLSYAQFQKVSIGHIDEHYRDVLSKEKLYEIIKEIEDTFESQLGMNVFDYSIDGKPIDVIYMPPSKKKKKLLQNLKNMELFKDDMNALSINIDLNKKSLNSSKKLLNNEYKELNQFINKLNEYILKVNKSSNQISKSEYEKVKKYVSNEQKKISSKTMRLEQKKKKLNIKIATLKNEIRKYNLLVSRYNRLQRSSEQLSKSTTEVKGITKSKTKITYLEDGDSIKKKSSEIYMEKIEIYDFEDLALLKVILAHEIGHLVGVEHINTVGALMNPYIQKEQLKDLLLTKDDVKVFNKAINSF